MSEFDEKQNDVIESENTEAEGAEVYKDEYSEFGTIFSDPSEHKARKTKSSTKKGLTVIISSVLVLAIVIGSIFALIEFVPTLNDDAQGTSSMLYTDGQLYENDLSDLDSVTVTNSNGTYTFLCDDLESTDSSEDTGKVWYVQGMDKDMVDSTAIEEMLAPAASLTVKRAVDTKTPEQCGFENPKYTVKVTSEKRGNYTLYVGADSPDNTGTYVMTDASENIYIAYNTAITNFDFDIIDLASKASFEPVTFNKSVISYCNDEGTLETFDTIKVSGKRFASPVTLNPNKDESITAYFGYMVTSPMKRNANSDNVDKIFSIFSSGLATEGGYAYDVTPASLAKFGLDNPDVVAQITVAGETKTYKIANVDDSYCAVINDDSKMIKKVLKSTIGFSDYTETSLYSPFIYLRAIGDISNISVSFDDKAYSFDVTKDDKQDDVAKKYSVECNGKKITYDYYQNLYQELVGLTCSDFTTEAISGDANLTLSYTNSNNGKVTTIKFYKCSATKYQYTVDGVPFGKIVSSAYNRIVKYANNVANDKDING